MGPRYTSYFDFDDRRHMWRFWWPTARNSGRWIPVIGSTRFTATASGEGDHARTKVIDFLMKHYVLPADPRATPRDLGLSPLPERWAAAIEPVGRSVVIDLRSPEEREGDPVGEKDLAAEPKP